MVEIYFKFFKAFEEWKLDCKTGMITVYGYTDSIYSLIIRPYLNPDISFAVGLETDCSHIDSWDM